MKERTGKGKCASKKRADMDVEMQKSGKGHYAWDCIGEMKGAAGKRLLDQDEKTLLCRKIGGAVYKPSKGVTLAVKIAPFFAVLTLVTGMKFIVEETSAPTFTAGIFLFAFSLIYMVFALFFYLVKEIWIYDRWKTQEKEIMKREVYRIPVTIGDTFQAGGRHKYYYANLRYTEEENFLDTYQITEYMYDHVNELQAYCCFYEGKPEKYRPGKYKLFYIDCERINIAPNDGSGQNTL